MPLSAGVLAAAVLAAWLPAEPLAGRVRGWELQTSGVEARLRGVSAVSDTVVWASGTGGTVLRTSDGGVTWARLTVPDANQLDFRDIDAVGAESAYVLSIGA